MTHYPLMKVITRLHASPTISIGNLFSFLLVCEVFISSFILMFLYL